MLAELIYYKTATARVPRVFLSSVLLLPQLYYIYYQDKCLPTSAAADCEGRGLAK